MAEAHDERPVFVGEDSTSLTIHYVRRVINVHQLTSNEIDDLVSGNASLYLTFLGLVFGADISVVITLLTVALGVREFAGFIAALIVLTLFSLLFAALAFKDNRAQRRKIQRIKGEQP